MTAPRDVQAWIAESAVPLASVAAGSGFDDLERMHAVSSGDGIRPAAGARIHERGELGAERLLTNH